MRKTIIIYYTMRWKYIFKIAPIVTEKVLFDNFLRNIFCIVLYSNHK